MSWTSDCSIFLLAPHWQIILHFLSPQMGNQAVVSPILFTEWLTCRFCIIILHSMKVISTSVKFFLFIVFTVYSEKVCWISTVIHWELYSTTWIDSLLSGGQYLNFRGQCRIFSAQNCSKFRIPIMRKLTFRLLERKLLSKTVSLFKWKKIRLAYKNFWQAPTKYRVFVVMTNISD